MVKLTWMKFFRQRFIEPESLDHTDPAAARLNLADIVRLNRDFGGHNILRGLLRELVSRNERFTMLDVGAASGDTAQLVCALYPKATVVNLDCNEVNLAGAPHPKILGDALRMPVRDCGVDFVFCSLFLHHFSDEQVTDLLRTLYKIAKRAVLISDLERNIVSYCFLPMTGPVLGWCPITIHDGMISVRASFRADELAELARRAGINEVQVKTHRPAFRVSMIALRNPR
jgi:2-polyprenyl-3-methyl-5-hydroxy-6-metoxy-1,4-benzoquinol methylase